MTNPPYTVPRHKEIAFVILRKRLFRVKTERSAIPHLADNGGTVIGGLIMKRVCGMVLAANKEKEVAVKHPKRWVPVLCVGVLLAVMGCEGPKKDVKPVEGETVISGTVASVDPGRQMLTCEFTQADGGKGKIVCHFFPESEILVKGKKAALGQIKIGQKCVCRGVILDDVMAASRVEISGK